jgi:histidyl-tRNA synthetase
MKTNVKPKPHVKPVEKVEGEKNAKSSSLYALVQKEIDLTGIVAHHYGFTAVMSPKVTPEDKSIAKKLSPDIRTLGESQERLALMRLFQDGQFSRLPQPTMLYFKRPFSGSESKKKTAVDTCGLQIFNVSRAAAEALIIQAAWAMLADSGCDKMRVEINSIGDKESLARFTRELQSYFRKHIGSLSAEYREKYKENIFAIAGCSEKECGEFADNAPKSLSSLSEASRGHFKELLEFLESADLPYVINSSLLPNTEYASHTCFEIRGSLERGGPEVLLARGGRYNYLAKKAGYKRDVVCCDATIYYPKKLAEEKKVVERVKPAHFYLVQLGNLAKFQTLTILEMLRRENIGVYHALTKESITGQLASAEYLHVSHLLIIGQKEAMEKSVVVRSADVRDQETVKVCDLCIYLKKIQNLKK